MLVKSTPEDINDLVGQTLPEKKYKDRRFGESLDGNLFRGQYNYQFKISW